MRSLRHPFRLTPVYALLLSAFVFACADRAPEAITEPVAAPDFAAVNVDDLRAAIAAQERHTPRLMANPGVVGTGVGLNAAGKPTVTVFLAHGNVPDLPAAVDGIAVTRKVTGMFYALASNPTTKARPAPLGFSVGHPKITAGTIGARVKNVSGQVFILSNNHVLANSNNASIGDAILQPGPYDGGTSADQIGTLADFQTILFGTSNQNTMDAAIALVNSADLYSSTPTDAGYQLPSATIVDPALQMKVQKYGRTTAHTKGTVAEINATVDVCYSGFVVCRQVARFVNQITITPGSFSDGGDSGSLIVTDDNSKNPVGLLFAGSDTRTIANPIGPVLQRFGVVIDVSNPAGGGQANVAPTVSISAPAAGATVSGSVAVTASASDSDGTVSSVQFFVDGTSLGTDTNGSDGWSAPWNTTNFSNGSHTLTARATDNVGASTTSAGVTVTVSNSTGGAGIQLDLSAYKVKGVQHADLSWSGATSGNVDVLRNGTKVVTTANDGSHTDNIGNKGGGSYTYKVCEAGTATCSNEAVAAF